MKSKNKVFIDDRDYQNMVAIFENDRAVGSRNNGLRILIYSLFICIFNKHQAQNLDELFVINGKESLRLKNANNINGIHTLHYAVTSNNVFKYRRMLTHVSYIKFCDRFRLIVAAIKYRKETIPTGYFVDYLLWKKFFSIYQGSYIGGFGHYDRLTTQLALLSFQFNKKYYMRQHGLIGHKINLPYKFPVAKIIAFDETEISKFKSEIVSNSDCVYRTNYVSYVNFEYTAKNDKRIGIIDVPINEMPELIHCVEKCSFKAQHIIMLHPLTKLKPQNFKNGFTFISGKKKELNYDIIFSGPSTLVYDYVRAGFQNPIIVYIQDRDHFSGLCDVEKMYKNVFICYSIKEFSEQCMQFASNLM